MILHSINIHQNQRKYRKPKQLKIEEVESTYARVENTYLQLASNKHSHS